MNKHYLRKCLPPHAKQKFELLLFPPQPSKGLGKGPCRINGLLIKKRKKIQGTSTRKLMRTLYPVDKNDEREDVEEKAEK